MYDKNLNTPLSFFSVSDFQLSIIKRKKVTLSLLSGLLPFSPQKVDSSS